MSEYSMSEEERSKAFPIHIELGKKISDMPMASDAKPVKGRPKVFFPRLFIDGVEGLDQLPKEGCMLVDFRRKRLSLDENENGEDRTGVELEIRRLCLPEDMMAEDAPTSLEDAFKESPDEDEPAEKNDDDEEDEE